jgi:hypothetical protein
VFPGALFARCSVNEAFVSLVEEQMSAQRLGFAAALVTFTVAAGSV